MRKAKRPKIGVPSISVVFGLMSYVFFSRIKRKCGFSCLKGFSLLELILVVLLLSVIAGLTVPNFRNSFSSLQLKQTANDLSYSMRYAQSRAVSKGCSVQLEFNSEMSAYWLTQSCSNSGEEDPEDFQRITGRMGREFSIPQAVQIELEKNPIRFYPDGTMEKMEARVCRFDRCLIISTKIQRGNVHVFEANG